VRPILRVLLVDDHGFVRSAIRQALTAPDIEVVGEAPSAEEALTSCSSISTCPG
jgi:DNA-binding NarL/FixJ family response regulator